jgi:hypothetical protein
VPQDVVWLGGVGKGISCTLELYGAWKGISCTLELYGAWKGISCTLELHSARKVFHVPWNCIVQERYFVFVTSPKFKHFMCILIVVVTFESNQTF